MYRSILVGKMDNCGNKQAVLKLLKQNKRSCFWSLEYFGSGKLYDTFKAFFILHIYNTYCTMSIPEALEGSGTPWVIQSNFTSPLNCSLEVLYCTNTFLLALSFTYVLWVLLTGHPMLHDFTFKFFCAHWSALSLSEKGEQWISQINKCPIFPQ